MTTRDILRAMGGSALVRLLATTALPAVAGGFDADPCSGPEQRFATAREAVEAHQAQTHARLATWQADPSTVPATVMDHYRNAVRAYAYKTWKERPGNDVTVNDWGLANEEENLARFVRTLYPAIVTPEQETALAHRVFLKNLEDTLRPQIEAELASQSQELAQGRADLDGACSKDVVSQVMRTSVGRIILIVGGNFAAAGDEDGILAAGVRAISGISVTDILTNGIRGGENSELAKLHDTWTDALDHAGIGENNELRAIMRALDPTNLDLPDMAKVTLDGDSLGNAITNASGGLIDGDSIDLDVTLDDETIANIAQNATLGTADDVAAVAAGAAEAVGGAAEAVGGALGSVGGAVGNALSGL